MTIYIIKTRAEGDEEYGDPVGYGFYEGEPDPDIFDEEMGIEDRYDVRAVVEDEDEAEAWLAEEVGECRAFGFEPPGGDAEVVDEVVRGTGLSLTGFFKPGALGELSASESQMVASAGRKVTAATTDAEIEKWLAEEVENSLEFKMKLDVEAVRDLWLEWREELREAEGEEDEDEEDEAGEAELT